MNEREHTDPIDDTEAQAAAAPGSAEAAEEEDDTEGHRVYATSDRHIKDEVEPLTWEDDSGDGDVDGHRFYSSDRHIKNEVEPLTWEEDDDTEGHGASKDSAEETAEETDEGDGDVAGHRAYPGSDRHIKNEVQPLRWENDSDRRSAGS